MQKVKLENYFKVKHPVQNSVLQRISEQNSYQEGQTQFFNEMSRRIAEGKTGFEKRNDKKELKEIIK